MTEHTKFSSEVIEFLKQNNLKNEDVFLLTDIANKIVAQKNLRIRKTEFEIYEKYYECPTGEKMLWIELYINTQNFKETLDIQYEFINMLHELPDDLQLYHFIRLAFSTFYDD
jgi:hypothetical protein